MRPVTLRIAVGPASSDDLKVVQALTQAFTRARGYVRLRPLQTDGAAASAKALEEGKADLAIIRGDLDVPKNAQAVATLRKNVAVLWVPPAAKGKGKKSGPKITKDSAARRTPHRRRRPHPGQRQSAQGDPAPIWRRSKQGRDRSVSPPAKPPTPSATRGRMPISPPDRSTARSPRRRSMRRRATAGRRLSSLIDFGRGDCAKQSRVRGVLELPPAPSAARPPNPTTR